MFWEKCSCRWPLFQLNSCQLRSAHARALDVGTWCIHSSLCLHRQVTGRGVSLDLDFHFLLWSQGLAAHTTQNRISKILRDKSWQIRGAKIVDGVWKTMSSLLHGRLVVAPIIFYSCAPSFLRFHNLNAYCRVTLLRSYGRRLHSVWSSRSNTLRRTSTMSAKCRHCQNYYGGGGRENTLHTLTRAH